ncbi:hypothetical protein EVAR_48277_1 [Eumeta japonica]|uniref:Uncharacterized protein n=1 Tax=Eumeta variegata TaxID=151549 RepID=A0A4C1WNG0_EUMVA|nr:hypothetical protein EVAR_48277_1 [Eumeta japonica]
MQCEHYSKAAFSRMHKPIDFSRGEELPFRDAYEELGTTPLKREICKESAERRDEGPSSRSAHPYCSGISTDVRSGSGAGEYGELLQQIRAADLSSPLRRRLPGGGPLFFFN